MISQKNIEDIVSDAVWAPSGENAQPWRFIIEDNLLHIMNIPEADNSIYNFKQRGSYIAHGALLENIVIAAQEQGYKTNIEIFPNTHNPECTAIVTFTQNSMSESSPLYQFIRKRVTNRKEYTGAPLTNNEKKILWDSLGDTLNTLHFVDDKLSLCELGSAAALNEKIIFENKELHDFFYEHILWNKDEDKKKGFYIKSLEFKLEQLPLVKIFSHWKTLKLVNKIFHISKLIASDNAAKYADSGTFFALTIPDERNISFITLGRTLQRFWLTATKLNLAVQPCTGVLFFMQRIRSGHNETFDIKHISEIENAYTKIKKVFDITEKNVVIMGRIGYASTPSGRASRLPPIIQYEKNNL